MTSTSRTALSAEHPFPGLRPYAFEDSQFYFGREDQIYSLYRLLDRSHFIAVVGGSGSGKSSLVRAGLLPLLDAETTNAGGRSWRWVEMRPGDAPLSRLADAVASLLPESDDDVGRAVNAARRERIGFSLRQSSFGLAEALDKIEGLDESSFVLVVDQFEELFRYATSAASQNNDPGATAQWREDAAHFVQLLLEISRSRARAVHVIITMRSDFIGDCARFHGLPEAVSATQFLVPSLTRDQREEVIRKPIEKAGATIEPTLVERMLNDGGDELDQLPVVQHCLMRLWDRAGADAATPRAPGQSSTGAAEAPPAAGRQLTLEHYQAVGGIAGALSQHAEEVLASLPGLELAVEQVFRALAEIDREGRAIRRALRLDQLVAETGVPNDQVCQVLDRFRANDCSFLVPPISSAPSLQAGNRVDVGHEALLRRWERISAIPEAIIPGQEAQTQLTGWLRGEEEDGRHYRGLLAFVDTIGAETLPLHQVEAHWRWWCARPRTEAWAERYGGGFERVELLLKQSLAALETERQRQAKEKTERETARRQAMWRRRWAAGTAVFILLGSVAFASYRAQEARRDAEIARLNTHILSLLTATPVSDTRAALDAATEAEGIIKRELQADPGNTQRLGELAFAYSRMGDVQAAARRREPAFEAYRRSLAIRTQLAQADSQDSERQRDLAASHAVLGSLFSVADRPEEATDEHRQALVIREKLAVADPGDAQAQRNLATSYSSLAGVLSQSKRDAEATDYLRKARAVMEPLIAAEPRLARDLAATFRSIGDVQLKAEREEEAVESYQKSLATLQQNAEALGKGGQLDLAETYQKIGEGLLKAEQRDDALDAHRESVRILKTLADAEPNDVGRQRELLSSYDKFADMLRGARDREGMLEYYRKAVEIRTALVAADPRNWTLLGGTALNHGRVGSVLMELHRRAEALSAFQQTIAMLDKVAVMAPHDLRTPRHLRTYHGRVGAIHSAEGQRDDAISSYRKSVAAAESVIANNAADSQGQAELAVALRRLALAGDNAQANLTRALKIVMQLRTRRTLPPAYGNLPTDIRTDLNRMGTPEAN